MSPIRCDNFSEAATVCLDHCEHLQNTLITVKGDLQAQFELEWAQASQSAIDSRNNLVETVEDGASCLAILVIEELNKKLNNLLKVITLRYPFLLLL